MKTTIFTCCAILCFLLIYSCSKQSQPTTATAVQQAISGKWQVDSGVFRSIFDDSLYFDSIYQQHFVNITNNGNRVTINMAWNDAMTYTIQDSTLYPYVARQSATGCGMPGADNIQISFSDAKHFSLNSLQGTARYSLYLHRAGQ